MLTGDQIPCLQPSISRPWSLGAIILITTNILGAHRVPGPTLSALYGLATKCLGSIDTTLGGGAGNWRNPETSEIKFIIQRRKRNLGLMYKLTTTASAYIVLSACQPQGAFHTRVHLILATTLWFSMLSSPCYRWRTKRVAKLLSQGLTAGKRYSQDSIRESIAEGAHAQSTGLATNSTRA